MGKAIATVLGGPRGWVIGGAAVPVALAAVLFAAAPKPTAGATPAAVKTVQSLPAPPANGEMGFVVDRFAPTYEQNDDDCPEGLASMLRENFVAALPPPEKSRLQQKENSAEFVQRYQAFAQGPGGTNVCTNFDQFVREPQRTVQGRTAKGFNLDGAGASGSASGCGQANFVSPAGEAGIDNQVWRAMGCLRTFRGTKEMPPLHAQTFEISLANGENAQVILLRGVDSLVNDDDVEITYGNTRDRAVVDASRNFLGGASYALLDSLHTTNVMKGRIVNGVLEAITPELRLRQVYHLGAGLRGEDIRGERGLYDFRRAKIRFEFQPDGSLKGMVGGYQPLANVILALSLGGIGAAISADWDCAAVYTTLRKMADGDRDSKSGQCTTISAAMEVHAVPAFVTPGKVSRSDRQDAGL